MSRSNCLLFAVRLFLRRGCRGYLLMRKSKFGNFPHFLYAERGHIVSFVPLNPEHKTLPPPLFRGQVRWGDGQFPGGR